MEEGGHLGALVHRALDRQEAAVQLINQTHVYHIAEGGTQTEDKSEST